MGLFAAFILLMNTALPVDEQRELEVGGATLHVHIRGADSGNPYALYLHGGPGYSSLPFMATAGPELERSLTVVYLDQRGCGLSSPLTPDAAKAYSLERLLRDIEEVRQQLGIEKWAVIAHAWGGLLGLHYVTQHPERVSCFINISGLVSVPIMTDDVLENAAAKAKQWLKDGSEGEKARAKVLLEQVGDLRKMSQSDPRRLAGAYVLALGEAHLYFHDPNSATVQAELRKLKAEAEKYKISVEKLDLAAAVSTALVQNESFHTMDATPLLKRVSVPTLLIGGRSDGVVTTRQLEIARRFIKGAQFEILDECGHFAFYEQPQKLMLAILRFLPRANWTPPGSG